MYANIELALVSILNYRSGSTFGSQGTNVPTNPHSLHSSGTLRPLHCILSIARSNLFITDEAFPKRRPRRTTKEKEKPAGTSSRERGQSNRQEIHTRSSSTSSCGVVAAASASASVSASPTTSSRDSRAGPKIGSGGGGGVISLSRHPTSNCAPTNSSPSSTPGLSPRVTPTVIPRLRTHSSSVGASSGSAAPSSNLGMTALSRRLLAKEWNVRLAANDELSPYFKKSLEDQSLPVKERALDALLIFIDHSAISPTYATELAPVLVNKCIVSTRDSLRLKSIEALLLFVEVNVPEVILEELSKACVQKVPRLSAMSLLAMREIVRQFGIPPLPADPILRVLQPCFEHSAQEVRTEAFTLVVALHQWLGDSLRQHIAYLRPAQMKELDSLLAQSASEKPLRTQRMSDNDFILKAQEFPLHASHSEDDSDFQGHTELYSAESSSESDISDIGKPLGEIKPQITPSSSSQTPGSTTSTTVESQLTLNTKGDILSRLTPDWYKRMEEGGWMVRKETLDYLNSQFPGSIDSNSEDFSRLIQALIKLLSDSNISVIASVTKCIELLAFNLGKEFGSHAKKLLPGLLDRLKEKKPAITTTIHNILDVLISGAVPLPDLMDGISIALNTKIPKLRYEVLLWLQHCMATATKESLFTVELIMTDSILKCLDDVNVDVRKIGFTVMGSFLDLLGDNLSKATVAVLLEKLERSKIAVLRKYVNSDTARRCPWLAQLPIAVPSSSATGNSATPLSPQLSNSSTTAQSNPSSSPACIAPPPLPNMSPQSPFPSPVPGAAINQDLPSLQSKIPPPVARVNSFPRKSSISVNCSDSPLSPSQPSSVTTLPESLLPAPQIPASASPISPRANASPSNILPQGNQRPPPTAPPFNRETRVTRSGPRRSSVRSQSPPSSKHSSGTITQPSFSPKLTSVSSNITHATRDDSGIPSTLVKNVSPGNRTPNCTEETSINQGTPMNPPPSRIPAPSHNDMQRYSRSSNLENNWTSFQDKEGSFLSKRVEDDDCSTDSFDKSLSQVSSMKSELEKHYSAMKGYLFGLEAEIQSNKGTKQSTKILQHKYDELLQSRSSLQTENARLEQEASSERILRSKAEEKLSNIEIEMKAVAASKVSIKEKMEQLEETCAELRKQLKGANATVETTRQSQTSGGVSAFLSSVNLQTFQLQDLCTIEKSADEFLSSLRKVKQETMGKELEMMQRMHKMNNCSACKGAPRQVVVLPCQHMLCSACATGPTCPICGERVTSRINVFV
ncbi:Spindle pole body component alp14 [Pelomyxa schiedti]|nr:Spindle pole body component alp14 [Pelomyxa schiedti]